MVGGLFLSFVNCLKILICDTLPFRIERLELFDEFEEWYMMQASQLFIIVLLIVCYKKCLNTVTHILLGPWGGV